MELSRFLWASEKVRQRLCTTAYSGVCTKPFRGLFGIGPITPTPHQPCSFLADMQMVIVNHSTAAGSAQDDPARGQAVTGIDDKLVGTDGDFVGVGRLRVVVDTPHQVEGIAIHHMGNGQNDVIGNIAGGIAIRKPDSVRPTPHLRRGGNPLARDEGAAWSMGRHKPAQWSTSLAPPVPS